ncbi:hypothetical protein BOO86_20405 [Mycobacterium sp. CBMA 234]|nr:hypothetical protein [Mycolicibacterium sp. CBMA 234]
MPMSRVLFYAIAAMAFLYLPLAINYMWPVFSPGVPRLQDGINGLINGRSYAVGPDSVESARHADYARHRVVMGIHTTLAGLALAAAMFQFSTRLRTRRPAIHRWTGRAYLALMTVSMLCAIAFLAMTMPVHHFIGRAFDLQLWGLAVGTLASGWIAFVAILRRDVVSHRAWMGYSIALMMAAPLQRVLWIGVQPFIPQHDLLTNLGVSAILLGVVAPFGAAVAFMLTNRGRGGVAGSLTGYRMWLAVAVFGSVTYAALFSRLPDSVPNSVLGYHLVPVWLAAGITVVGIRNARAEGNAVREQRWCWLFAGVALAPVAASVTALVAAPVYTATDAVIAGGMVGAPLPITAAFALVVWKARVPRRTPAPAAQLAPA